MSKSLRRCLDPLLQKHTIRGHGRLVQPSTTQVVSEPLWSTHLRGDPTAKAYHDYLAVAPRSNPIRIPQKYSRGERGVSYSHHTDQKPPLTCNSGQITPILRHKLSYTRTSRPPKHVARSSRANITSSKLPNAHKMETRSKNRRVLRSGYAGISKSRTQRQKDT